MIEDTLDVVTAASPLTESPQMTSIGMHATADGGSFEQVLSVEWMGPCVMDALRGFFLDGLRNAQFIRSIS